MKQSIRTVVMAAMVLCGTSLRGTAQATRIDPRNPSLKYLPELGRMVGKIKTAVISHAGEEYGSRIYKLFDCNQDKLNDWAVSHRRCDTLFKTLAGANAYAEEVLLYHGVKGGLPAVESGQRIGPSEVNSQTRILTSGNWDGDPYRDLCMSISIIGDTSHGRPGFSTARAVVFWGQPDGNYTLADTTRLVLIDDLWGAVNTGYSGDLDGSGVETLFIRGEAGISNGKPILTPLLHFFKGHRQGRWGRDGISRSPTWTWYSNRNRGTIGFIDQNADGHLDFVEYSDKTDIGVYGSVSVTYGSPNGYFDTNDVESVRFDSIHGHISKFVEITGDLAPAAPELLVNTGDDNTCRIYAGKRGQRLREQFGDGDDPPVEGKGWWARPWAVIWMPAKLDDGWGVSGYNSIFDLGDANLDGIGDIWTRHEELLLCHTSGTRLDSLIDAIGRSPYHDILSIGNLGDIDGSGVPTIAMSYDQFPADYQHPFNGAVMFVKPSDEVPTIGGSYRRLPQQTTDAPEAQSNDESMGLSAVPNPSDGRVALSWKKPTSGWLIISDALGQETLRANIGAASQEYVWDTSQAVSGVYFITLEADHQQSTIKIGVL